MVLNWTAEVLISFIASGMASGAAVILICRFAKKRERHILWLMLFSLSYLVYVLLYALSDLLLSLPLLPFAFLPMCAGGYGLIFATDAISREKIEPVKISVWTAFVVVLFFLSFQPDSFTQAFFPNENKSLGITGIFELVAIIGLLFTICPFLYYTIKIHRRAPQNAKKYSMLLLAGVTLFFLAGGFEAFQLPLLIPGISYVTATIGMLLVAIVFARQPTLAFLLPFQVMRLLVYDTTGGLPLFSHDWDREGKLVSQSLFSGRLQGIGIILGQWVNQGNVQEIQLARAVLLLHRSDKYPVECVLVATKASPTLRRALRGFAEAFYAQFANRIADTRSMAPFQPAEALVREWFAFVPSS